MKKLINFSMDCIMIALVYFGLYMQNQYAENILWFLMIVFGSISVLMIFASCNDEVMAWLKKDRQARGAISRSLSLLTDVTFCLMLASIGFVVLASIWLIIQMFVFSIVNKLDDEVIAENNSKIIVTK